MSIFVDGCLNRTERIESLFKMNPRTEYLRFLPAKSTHGFDKTTGLCAARTVTNYEIALFMENGGYSVIDGKKFDVHKGDIRFLRPGQTLYSKKFGDFFSLHFSFLETEEERIVNNDFVNAIPTFFPCHNLDLYVNIFKEMLVAGMDERAEDVLLMKTKMFELFCELYNSVQQHNRKLNKSLSVVEKAIEYMNDNLSSNLCLEELSKYLDLHPVYFNRLFSKTIGIPPMSYLKELRLHKAKVLLVTTNLKVVKIASMCGFSTSSYFIVQFKKKYGSTPSEYRAINGDNIYY